MCEKDDLAAMGPQGGFDWSVNRRAFVGLAAGALAACTSGSSDAANAIGNGAAGGGLAEGDVSFATPDGTMDAFFVRPASGKYPAILMWPDIAGVREANQVMARRLAAQGFAVLLANPYYRDVKAPQFADFAAFRSGDGFAKVGPWRGKLTPDAVMRDAKAAVDWLDAQPSVDTALGVGSNGYCMTGSFTVYGAAAVPGRIKAAASLHGGGLADAGNPQSPDKLIGKTQASFLFAIGRNDDAKEPETKDALSAAAKAAGRPAEVTVFAADHGWTVPDSPAYDQIEAEKAWARMSALFEGLKS